MAEVSTAAVTVVVPTYNRAASLARLLDALAACEPPAGGVEVVVVDDGSTDSTPDVVRRSPIGARYVRQDNRGPAAARNTGWRLARSSVVAFTDDDTLPDRRWLVDLVEALDAQPAWSAVGGNVQPLRRGFLADFVQHERLVGHGADERGVRYLITANAAYRTDALRAVGGFDEHFPLAAGEDADLSFRVTGAGGQLGVTDRGLLRHDHRTSARGLFRTYYRHGTARRRLAGLHADLGVAAPARTMLTPAYWVGRHGYYRARGAGRLQATGYCALRAVGLACYAGGVMGACRRESGGHPSPAQPPTLSSSSR